MKINNRIVSSTKIFTKCEVLFYNNSEKCEVKKIFYLSGKRKLENINQKCFKNDCEKNLTFIKVEKIKNVKITGEMLEDHFFRFAKIKNESEVF